jgi:hypothetical protein
VHHEVRFVGAVSESHVEKFALGLDRLHGHREQLVKELEPLRIGVGVLSPREDEVGDEFAREIVSGTAGHQFCVPSSLRVKR